METNSNKEISKDTFYSLAPINWLLRSSALSNIYHKEIHLSTYKFIVKSAIYVTVFVVLNIFCMYYKIKTFKGSIHSGLVRFYDVIQLTYLCSYFVYIVDVYYVCKYSQGCLLRYFKTFDRIDSVLGPPPFDEIRRSIINNTVLSIVVFVCICIFDYVCWVMVEGWISPSLYSIDYLYFFLNMLTILDMLSHILQIEHRLRMFGNLLQKCCTLRLARITTDVPPPYPDTTWFNKCYLLLLEQVAYFNASYGFRVLLHCVNVLFNMTHLLNLVIRVMTQKNSDVFKDYSALTWATILSSITTMLKAFNYALMVIILIYRCEQAYRQSERILQIIDEWLANNKKSNDLKTNILDFRNLLITRPIKFHAAKFFTMDYTLLVSLNSVVVTYTIIMFQNIK